VSAAVTIAESLVRMGLSTSKVRTYATPRVKKVVGWPMRLGRWSFIGLYWPLRGLAREEAGTINPSSRPSAAHCHRPV
jgi:hypothetical protein